MAHRVATDGAFRPDGTFMCLPTGSTELLLETWQTKVFNLLVAARWVDQHTVDQMRMWTYSGFSVDNSVYIPAGDRFGLERLSQYILRCPSVHFDGRRYLMLYNTAWSSGRGPPGLSLGCSGSNSDSLRCCWNAA